MIERTVLDGRESIDIPVTRIAQLFDVDVRLGRIRPGASYRFDRASKRFVESGGRGPSGARSKPPRTIAQARAQLRRHEFIVETDTRAELVRLRSKARGFRAS
jgi:hypothetical protein